LAGIVPLNFQPSPSEDSINKFVKVILPGLCLFTTDRKRFFDEKNTVASLKSFNMNRANEFAFFFSLEPYKKIY